VIGEPKKREAFILSEKGYLKRLPVSKFTLQGRGGKGMQSLRITKATGPVTVATVAQVDRTTKVDLLGQDGRRQRIPVAAVPRTRTRHSRGKKLAKLDQVIEIALL
jgi:DNA gyrase subunit A